MPHTLAISPLAVSSVTEEVARLEGWRLLRERTAHAFDTRGQRCAIRLEGGRARPRFLRERDKGIDVFRLRASHDDYCISPDA